MFGMQTGAARDQTTNLSVCRRPARPPELQPLKNPVRLDLPTPGLQDQFSHFISIQRILVNYVSIDQY